MAVAPNSTLRYQSAATLAAELRSVAAIVDVRGSTDEPEMAAPSTSASRIVVVAAIVVAIVALLLVLFSRS